MIEIKNGYRILFIGDSITDIKLINMYCATSITEVQRRSRCAVPISAMSLN